MLAPSAHLHAQAHSSGAHYWRGTGAELAPGPAVHPTRQHVSGERRQPLGFTSRAVLTRELTGRFSSLLGLSRRTRTVDAKTMARRPRTQFWHCEGTLEWHKNASRALQQPAIASSPNRTGWVTRLAERDRPLSRYVTEGAGLRGHGTSLFEERGEESRPLAALRGYRPTGGSFPVPRCDWTREELRERAR